MTLLLNLLLIHATLTFPSFATNVYEFMNTEIKRNIIIPKLSFNILKSGSANYKLCALFSEVGNGFYRTVIQILNAGYILGGFKWSSIMVLNGHI